MHDAAERTVHKQRIVSPNASNLAPHALTGTVLAFDFGIKRVGAAVGDYAVGIAHPLVTIQAEDKARRYAAIAALIKEWQPAVLLVGLPAHMDGTEHEISRLARKFARELGGRFNLPVELIDERLSSAMAEGSLQAAGVRGDKRKRVLDQAAAQEILQAHLDAAARARTRASV
jgi:putative Holliday junction resolvase